MIVPHKATITLYQRYSWCTAASRQFLPCLHSGSPLQGTRTLRSKLTITQAGLAASVCLIDIEPVVGETHATWCAQRRAVHVDARERASSQGIDICGRGQMSAEATRVDTRDSWRHAGEVCEALKNGGCVMTSAECKKR